MLEVWTLPSLLRDRIWSQTDYASAEARCETNQSKKRIDSFDTLRAIGIFGVIWLHYPAEISAGCRWWQFSTYIFRFAVPCFFMLSGFFFMKAWVATPSKSSLISRYAVRLCIPFIFWSLFYALVPPFISGAPEGISVEMKRHLDNIIRFPVSFLLTGNTYHLWFISALGQAILLLWLHLKFANLRVAVALGITLYCIALLAGPYSSTTVGFHFHHDIKTGPLFSMLFVALGAFFANLKSKPKWVPCILLVVLGFTLQAIEAESLLVHYGESVFHQSFFIGTVPFAVGFFLLALSSPAFSAHKSILAIGRYSLGLYVLHPYIIECLKLLLPKVSLLQTPFAFVPLVLLLSISVLYLLSRVKILRPLLI